MQKTKFQENILKVSIKNQIKIEQFCKPLLDHFFINYFYYFKLTQEGYYATLSNHLKWNELVFTNNLHHSWPYFRHPSFFENEIKFFFDRENPKYSPVLNVAKESFNINVCLQLLNKTPTGIEGFGFGTHKDFYKVSQLCLNDLNLIYLFVQQFQHHFSHLFYELENFQVSMKDEIGPLFFERSAVGPHLAREDFLQKIGIKTLAKREKEVINYLLRGHSANQIALNLSLSRRTVESYIENIKNKLSCHNKSELIEKARFLI